MAETELLPCVHCGGDPYVHQVDYCDPPEWIILCLNGDCGGSHPTEAEAIAAWNRRPPDPAAAELVEAAEDALAYIEGNVSGSSQRSGIIRILRALLAKHAAKP